MRIRRLIFAGYILCLVFILAGFLYSDAWSQAKPVIKLTCANYFPPAHRLTLLQGEFCKEIEKRTNGRVQINYLPGGSLLAPGKTPEGVIQRIADIGCAHIGYSRGRFPQMEIFATPLGFPDAWVAAQCANDFFKKYRPKEWDSVHVHYLHAASAGALMTSKKPLRVLEDLKGVTLRSIGLTADTLAAMGATPRDLPVGEIYEAIQKGVIDGAAISLEAAKGFKLAEVTRYLTYSWQISEVSVFYVIMNKDAWNNLPGDIKKIFDEVSEDYRQKFARTWNELNIEGKSFFKSKKGNEYYELSPEEGARWHRASLPVIYKWLKSMVNLGFPEKEQREHIAFVQERIKYWTEKEKELGIPTPLRD